MIKPGWASSGDGVVSFQDLGAALGAVGGEGGLTDQQVVVPQRGAGRL